VSVSLRDVPLDLVRSVVVDLEYPPTGLVDRLVLSGEEPTGRWEAVVRERPGPYRFRVTWVTAEERIQEDWVTSSSPTILLDVPVELVRTAGVSLVSAGDFAGLAQIVVDLRPNGREEAVDTFAFSAPGQTASWEPRTADAGSFRYQARTTLVHADGQVRAGEWTDEDRPVLVVRDYLGFEVLVVPRLLDLGGALSLALLELEYEDDAEDLHERASFVLRDPLVEPRWRLSIGAPDRHTYRYRLTLIRPDGSRTVLPWREAGDGILVLRPGD
jgi:hypothetical protein